ncbi:N-acetyltransferase [Nocardioides sp.]|uniref:GNAT family N-acetyltransferase n=1 Tax=Nocardioides sp. TaxID=35761 RepID=UPI0027187AA3|nr:GNAT family N-acetyltransferase [Nocardioides sp.]MDO9457843.1 GNAT family N-acetyltransferase [Nocardioides sp.]
MDIVRVGPDDWVRFRTVRLASLADAPSAFGSSHDDWRDASEERWRRRLTDVPLTLVARDGHDGHDGHDGRVVRDVGVVSGQVHGESWAELISMWVDPSVRGTGVAQALITAVVGWAERQGRSTYLMVRSDNARARAAYERLGFVDRGVPDGWSADEPPEHRMELRPGADGPVEAAGQ